MDSSRLLEVRKVSDVIRVPRLAFAFIVLKMRFPPSVEESKHGWRTAMHLQGRNEVKNRNAACVMEVASMGSCATMRTKEGGKSEKLVGNYYNSAEMERSEMKASPY
jgi:hypothetical protein